MHNTSKEYKMYQIKGTKLNLWSVWTIGLSENCMEIYIHKNDFKNVPVEHEVRYQRCLVDEADWLQ